MMAVKVNSNFSKRKNTVFYFNPGNQKTQKQHGVKIEFQLIKSG